MYVNAGNLNKKIQIIKFEETKDKDGFPIKIENIVLKSWAQVTNISGTELIKSNSDFAQIKTRFLIRSPKEATKSSARMGTPCEQSERGAIEKDMFIKFKGNFYNIIYINNYSFKDGYTEIITELVMK